MKNIMRCGVASCLGLWLAACYQAPVIQDEKPEERVRTETYSATKDKLIFEMEGRMRALLGRYEGELNEIRDQLIESLEFIRPPVRLLAVERQLRAYGAAEQERYDAEIDRLVTDAVDRTEAITGSSVGDDDDATMGLAEIDAMEDAKDVGGMAEGGGFGLVSGIPEVDEQATVALQLLQGLADVDGLKDLGEIYKNEKVELNEMFTHDLTLEKLSMLSPKASEMADVGDDSGPDSVVGRFTLFQSDPVVGLRLPTQENQTVVLSFQNDGLPSESDYSVVQGLMVRVLRGGMVVQDFPWRLDPQTSGQDGRVDMRFDQVDPRFVATVPMTPALDVFDKHFDRLRDFTLLYNFQSGFIDEGTGEIIGIIFWQLRWRVSSDGSIQVVPPQAPFFGTDTSALAALIEAGPMPSLAERVVTEGDRLVKSRSAGFAAILPPERDVGDGKTAVLVEIVGDDRRKVLSEGRRYLLGHRLHLLTEDLRLFRYRDGEFGRDVLVITSLAEDSALRDFGFRVRDRILSINGKELRSFPDLWSFMAENPREENYEVVIRRNGAQRKLLFEVEGVPPRGVPEEIFDENPTEEMMSRLARLFADVPPKTSEK